MNKEKVDEILKKVTIEWEKKGKVDKNFFHQFKIMLEKCPDEDGLKRVVSMETGKVYLVPYEYIILNGLKGDELNKFEVEENGRNK